METSANLVEATKVGSNLSGDASIVPSSSPHGTGGRSTENIRRIDRKLYEAAVKGSFIDFANVHNIENLLTPNKNNVFHIHLISQTTKNVSTDFVEHILDKCGCLLLQPNVKGETPLHIAASYGHSNIVKLLIERSKDQDVESGIEADKKFIRATNKENDTALHEAVRYNHIEVVEILMEKDPDHSYSANNANETPLYLATERRYGNIVQGILKKMTSPAYDGPNGRTALHAAVINRDIEMTRELLDKEHLMALVRHADNQGWIPLHHAVKMGCYDLAELLLEQDENTAYIQDNDGKTALHIASHCGNWILMEMVIKYCPDCSELVDNKGWNALHYAVNGGSYFAMKEILSNPLLSNLYNEKDVDGNTPLHHLATSLRINPILVYHPRVDKLAMNKEHKTALDAAYSNNDSVIRQSLVRDLKDAGSRPSGRVQSSDENNQMLVFSKDARESHLLVTTLIATVSFAAGFTLPGGTLQDGDLENKGSPTLLKRPAFKAFIITDTAALVLSASAAFIHLFSPLNKTRSNDDFLSEIAFSFTLVWVASMIVAFATGTYALVGSSPIGIVVLSAGLLFFLVFRQVLEMNFRSGFVFTFIKNVADVILFSINRLTSTTVRPIMRYIQVEKIPQRGKPRRCRMFHQRQGY